MRSIFPGLFLTICALHAQATPRATQSAVPSRYQGLADMLDFEPVGQSWGATYYAPTQDQRDIEVMTLDLSRGWRLGSPFELQGRFTIFHAHGARTDVPYGVNPDSEATGAAVGPALRFYFLDFLDTWRVRPFIEGSAQVLFTPGTGDGFPAGGSGVNGFERAGAGVLVHFSPHWAIEATYQWYSHASNAAGLHSQNPMWNGRGGSLALRREL